MTELQVAVADLARFCHRRGDLDHRFTPSPTAEQGVAGHQRLYARRPAGYRREFPVEYLHQEERLRLILRGRADGYDPAQGLVEEIKTCRVDPAGIPAAVWDMHLAQGRLYAAVIAAAQHGSCGPDESPARQVRLTWFNIDTEHEYSQTESYTRDELASFLADTLERFAQWMRTLAALRSARDASLRALAFPHGDFRPGQRAIAELTYKCIDQGGQLLVEAPTGIGKTAAVLYPALKALATGKHDKVVFVTARTVGRRTVEATLHQFRGAGYRGTALSLTAKESICLSPGRACHPDDCPYARGYYDRLPAALAAAVQEPALRRQELEALGRRFAVCPYQLSLDLLPWVDVIVADQHYVFSLSAVLNTLMQSRARRWSVLLDEAHNLPDRARGMYSAKLTRAGLLAARAQLAGGTAGKHGKALRLHLDRINRVLLSLQKSPWVEAEFDARAALPDALPRALREFTGATAQQSAEQPALLQRHPALMAFFFDALQFLRVSEQWGDDYRLELRRGSARQSLCVTLNCLDPARLLARRHRSAHSLTAFSATLSPLPWTRSRLGLEQGAVTTRTASPFACDQLQVLLATDVDTRFTRRGASLPALARRLRQWLAREPGNCLLYFSSYGYLHDGLQAMADAPELARRTVWVQCPQQSDSGREQLLELLARRRDVAAFCILGGVFGEGIDLPGEQLSSVVVVGVGLPQVNRDTRQLQDWYQQRYGAGFEYAFVYPGMQKVDQALGRVVRRMEDRGSALLIDSRYRQRQYRELLPPWWHYTYCADGESE